MLPRLQTMVLFGAVLCGAITPGALGKDATTGAAGTSCDVAAATCPVPRCPGPPHSDCTLSTDLKWTDDGECCEEMCVYVGCPAEPEPDCSDDASVCGEGEYCHICKKAIVAPGEDAVSSECKLHIKKGTACSQGFMGQFADQCSGHMCAAGLECTEFRSYFPIADHPPVCCPVVEEIDCGEGGRQLVDSSGCLADQCDPTVCKSNADCCDADDTCHVPRGGSVNHCVGPSDRIGTTVAEGCPENHRKPPPAPTAAWCPDSADQLCRKVCEDPKCDAETECAMRSSSCCAHKCQARDEVEAKTPASSKDADEITDSNTGESENDSVMGSNTIGSVCSVKSEQCPMAKCSEVSPGCVPTRELEWQLGGWCCPKLCVFTCGGATSAGGSSSGPDDKDRLSGGLVAIVVLSVITLLAAVGLMLFYASKRETDFMVNPAADFDKASDARRGFTNSAYDTAPAYQGATSPDINGANPRMLQLDRASPDHEALTVSVI